MGLRQPKLATVRGKSKQHNSGVFGEFVLPEIAGIPTMPKITITPLLEITVMPTIAKSKRERNLG